MSGSRSSSSSRVLINSLQEGSWGVEYIQPLYDNTHNSWLISGGSNRIDDRQLVDVGFVYRYAVSPSSLVGVNLFVDGEPEKKHLRGSVGFEYRSPYLQMSSNHSMPLSDWQRRIGGSKNEPPPPARRERPASGYQLSTEIFNKWTPGISLSAEYARWSDESSGMNGNPSSTQRPPYRATAVLNWRFVPLVKLSVAQSYLPPKTAELTVNVSLQLNLSQPLAKQVKVTRSMGVVNRPSQLRHDLVHRNNDMVMRYRPVQTSPPPPKPTMLVVLEQIPPQPGDTAPADEFTLQATASHDGKVVVNQPIEWEVIAQSASEPHHVFLEADSPTTDSNGKVTCTLKIIRGAANEKVKVRAVARPASP